MNRQEAIAELKRMASTIEWDYPLDAQIAIEKAVEALRGPEPDPDTGLVPCEWCGPERMGWFSVQFWVRASTGKRKWMSVTQKYKKQVNYCPMCGRKLEVKG